MSTVLYEKKDNIAYVTLNRPERMNAINAEVTRELGSVWADLQTDKSVWVAIISGTGDRAFCAGIDLKEIHEGIGGSHAENFWYSERPRIFPYELDIKKPVIAAINGHCVGAGFALVLGCDIRIASENATFALPEVKFGMANRGDAVLLAKAAPLSLAMEMLFTGESISAQDAYRCGLINRLLPLPELMPTADKLARAICNNAPLAVRANKESVMKGLEIPFECADRLATSLNYALLSTDDYKEGIQAAIEKRKPQYKGM